MTALLVIEARVKPSSTAAQRDQESYRFDHNCMKIAFLFSGITMCLQCLCNNVLN